MSNKLKLKIIETTVDGINKSYCTFISQEHIFKYGLSANVIVGEVQKLDSGEVDFENSFVENTLFKKSIFDFLEKEIVNDPQLIESARQQDEGWVYILDQRTPTPDGEVPPYDIVGAFEVKEGVLEGFSANQNYQLKSENGFTDLGGRLNIKFNDYLKKLSKDEGTESS